MLIRLMKILDTLLVAVIFVFVLAACSGDMPEAAGDDQYAYIVVHAKKVDGSTRTEDNSGIESVSELQIIIANKSTNKIEVNETVDITRIGSLENYVGVYRLPADVANSAGEPRTIYAVGNPRSCGFDFSKAEYAVGADGSADAIASAIGSHAFDFDDSKPIVLTDWRSIDGALLRLGKRVDVTLNLVRVATKFSVNIVNERYEPVTLKSFKVNSLGDWQYLLPHFTGEDGQHVVRNAGACGFDFTEPFNGDTEFSSKGSRNMHWSEWMDLAVRESHKYSDEGKYTGDQTLADFRGWIMKYAVPDTDGSNKAVSTSSRSFALPADCVIPSVEETGKNTLALPTQYFAETVSGILPSSAFGNGAASGFEQSYTFDVSFESGMTPGVKTFTGCKFPNLRSLFRNTHVLLQINIGHDRISWMVRVVPYVGIELKPIFGEFDGQSPIISWPVH